MSKYCSVYAQRCREGCCDKYGECPQYSGRKCRYTYESNDASKEKASPDATDATAAAAVGGAGGAAAGAAVKEEAKLKVADDAAGGDSGKTTEAKNTQSSESKKGKGQDQPSEQKPRHRRPRPLNKEVESSSIKEEKSTNTEGSTKQSVVDKGATTGKSKWLSLPNFFKTGSSVSIIFWTLFGIGIIILLFVLYCCFCRKRTPYYAEGIQQRAPAVGTGFPGGNMGAYGAPVMPAQPGYAGNMVQANAMQGLAPSAITPTYTTSTLRLSRTGPAGMKPIR